MGRKSRGKKERRAKAKNQTSHTKRAIKVHPITEAIPKKNVQKSSVDEQFKESLTFLVLVMRTMLR